MQTIEHQNMQKTRNYQASLWRGLRYARKHGEKERIHKIETYLMGIMKIKIPRVPRHQ